MTRYRVPIRLATREVRRRPGRTLLVALLVALPVTGMALAVTLVRTGERTPAEEWAANQGSADAIRDSGRQVRDDELLDLPAGSRVLTVARSFSRVRAVDHSHRSDLEMIDLPLDDPMVHGILDLRAGRAPAAAGEVALSPHAARRLGVGLGDALDLDRPAAHLTVVGLVEKVDCISCPTALFAPGQVDASLGDSAREPTPTVELIDLPTLTSEQLQALRGRGDLMLREDALHPPFGNGQRGEGVRWTLVIGALVLMVVGIIISAAFAVGARRQLVTLGQLSASGAPPSLVRLALVLQGTITGILGAAGGLVLAAVLLVTLHDRFEVMFDHRFGSYDLRPLDHVAVVVVAVLAATLAALLPARTAARIPTLAALAGRRPLHPVRARLVLLGLVGVAVGLALFGLAVLGGSNNTSGRSNDVWAYVAIAGGVCELLGACAIAPALVSRLEPFAGRVRGAWRLGARSLARNRTRTGAVVSAVAAAGALAIASTACIRGVDRQDSDDLDMAATTVSASQIVDLPDPRDPNELLATVQQLPSAETQADIARVLPDAERVEVRTASAPVPADPSGFERYFSGVTVERPDDTGGGRGNGYPNAVIADDEVLDAVGLSSAGRVALDRDGLVVIGSKTDGRAIAVFSDDVRRPIQLVAAAHEIGRGSDVLITDELARQLGLTVAPTQVLYRNPEPLTSSQRDRIEDLQLDQDFGGRVAVPLGNGKAVVAPISTGFVDISWYRPPTGPSPFELELILTAIATVFALFVVGASLALAAAESKDERDVLTVAGAPPRSLARAAGARAWLLAGLGGILAVPVGFLPVVVFTQASTDPFPLVFPGTTVALLLVGVPTLVGLVAMATSATALRLRPVHVSTATFE